MNIYFEEFKNEIEELIDFMTSDVWEFYGTQNPKPERIRASYENNYYTGDDCKTFWIISEKNIKVGMFRIYDLEDGDPLFDIRILNQHKGNGIGTTTVKWLVDYIFNNFCDKNRIEANTRQDNYAMRCVFNKCGFTKESHYREAWVGQDGKVYDAVGYGITRDDWKNKKITPVIWNDFKC